MVSYGKKYGLIWVNNGSKLVGGIPTPLKHMNVSWDNDIPNAWTKMFQTTKQISHLGSEPPKNMSHQSMVVQW